MFIVSLFSLFPYINYFFSIRYFFSFIFLTVHHSSLLITHICPLLICLHHFHHVFLFIISLYSFLFSHSFLFLIPFCSSLLFLHHFFIFMISLVLIFLFSIVTYRLYVCSITCSLILLPINVYQCIIAVLCNQDADFIVISYRIELLGGSWSWRSQGWDAAEIF